MTPREWKEQQQKSVSATKDEMHAVLQLASSSDDDVSSFDGPVMLWSDDEELLSELDLTETGVSGTLWSLLRLAAGLGAFAASAVTIADMAGKGGLSVTGEKKSCSGGAWSRTESAFTDSKAHFV
jgi:hypothetical protein